MFGPTIDDVDHGNTGDCYFIAVLGAVAQANPDRVRKMVRRNANGSYTVTFHERGSWAVKASTFQVTVLPEFASGLSVARRGTTISSICRSSRRPGLSTRGL
jgi:hypothetical protein